jgi:hypothetical protein
MSGEAVGPTATCDGLGAVEGLGTVEGPWLGEEAGALQPTRSATSAKPAERRMDPDMATANCSGRAAGRRRVALRWSSTRLDALRPCL